MATSFYIRPSAGASSSKVYVKVRFIQNGQKSEIRLAVPKYAADVRRWNGVTEDGKPSPRTRDNYEKHEGKEMFDKLAEIRTRIEAEIKQRPATLDAAKVREIVNEVALKEENDARAEAERKRLEAEKARREEEERQKEEARRVTFLAYYDRFIKRKAKECKERTIINYRQGYNRLQEYQAARGITLDWGDLDRNFFDDYNDYLCNMPDGEKRRSAYNDATRHKRWTEIRTIVREAREEGITDCVFDTFKYANVAETETPDNQIYLTRQEVDSMLAVDLSGKAIGYTKARDIFLVGILTAQRISDYNNISRDDIRKGEDGRIYVHFKQKKTGKSVAVPANAELRALLEKYDNNLPHLADQLVNRYLKVIAQEAGIVQQIKTTSTKGGKVTENKVEKYKLVHSHTARRTGATWMYLSGMDAFDICRITGHESEKMLRTYIKADELEAAKKIADKYDYFK